MSDAYRHDYAERIARLSAVRDPRIEQAFATVPRESFLPPPPWTLMSAGIITTSTRIADIYDNVLVAIDRQRGINNGEPALHATWMDAVAPEPGEAVIHVGAGTGYYTAILSLLVQPGGHVEAYEYEQDLATQAEQNLQAWPNTNVHAGSAFGRVLPKADIVYVNAGVVAPDAEWLRALNPNGRLIFPWQPHRGWGPSILVTRRSGGFSTKSLMNVGFISCSGATEAGADKYRPSEADLASVHSIWLNSDRAPDNSAVAVYDKVWFSSEEIGS